MNHATTPPPPRSQRLRQKLALFASGLHADHERFWNGPDFPQRYPLLLREVYTISLSAPGSQMERVARFALSRQDEASHRVGTYLTCHVEEEKGHWDWVLDDLAVLGFDDRALEADRLPSMWASALVGCGYIWAMDHHPAAYLGFMSVFEGSPYSVAFLEDRIRSSGLPREAFRYYLDHARLDLIHSAEIFELMDELDLDAKAEQALFMCALQTQSLLHELLRSILDTPLPANLVPVGR